MSKKINGHRTRGRGIEVGDPTDMVATERRKLCLAGAADCAVRELIPLRLRDFRSPEWTSFSDKMWGYVLNQVPEVEGFFDPVVAFNDDPNTRHADVLNVLDAAIEEASRDCSPGRFNLIWPKKNGYEATEVFSYLNPR